MDASEPPSTGFHPPHARPLLAVEVAARAPGWRDAVEEVLLVRAAEAAYEAGEGSGAAEVSLLLGDDAEIRTLNRTWRGKDAPTNVLSFPLDAPHAGDGPAVLGDIALAFETVACEAQDRGIAFGQHAAHLVVHGMLHLLGHAHDDDRQARDMEALEVRVLGLLGIPDPYEHEPGLVASGEAR